MNLSGSPPRSKKSSEKAERQRRIAIRKRREAARQKVRTQRFLELQRDVVAAMASLAMPRRGDGVFMIT